MHPSSPDTPDAPGIKDFPIPGRLAGVHPLKKTSYLKAALSLKVKKEKSSLTPSHRSQFIGKVLDSLFPQDHAQTILTLIKKLRLRS